MARLAPSGHGRCVTAPFIVAGIAEVSMFRIPRPVSQRTARAGRASAARGARPRSPGLLIAAIAALALSALGPAVGRATVSADGAPTLPDMTFYGRGYGHGVGMSQYGARGRALAGQLAPAILAHYYARTTLGTRSTATIVRVLLLTGFAATPIKPLTVLGLGGGWTIDGIATTFPANARLTTAPTAPKATTWNLRVTSSTGVVLATRVVSGSLYVRPAGTTSLLQ